jgi:hypothetical protein
MMTERQYDYFKALYEEESTRSAELVERGKTYLTIVAAYSGFFAFTAKNWPGENSNWAIRFIFGFVALCLASSLATIVRALGIYSYEGLTDPVKLLEAIGTSEQSDDDFFDRRIADLAVAHNRNEEQNDRRAWRLTIASWLMVFAIVFHFVLVILTLTLERSPNAQKQKGQEAKQESQES